MVQIEILNGVSNVGIADWLEQQLERALATTSETIAVTVPGGSTPFPILAELTQRPLPWHRIVVWPGDDRLVPEDHPASNTGRIRELLEPAGAKVAKLDPVGRPPHFALAWLGMGGDGHIASLFPNTDPKADDPQRVRRLTPDPLPPEAPFDRITLTMPSLLDSEELLFVIRGQEKRALLEAAARGENDLPVARLLAAATQPVTCFT